MFEFHTPFGNFKKIVKSDSNLAKNLHNPIRKAFLLESTSSLHLQCWNTKHNDWVDCDENEELSEDTKLKVWQAVLESASLPTTSASFLCSTPSADIVLPPTFEESSIVEKTIAKELNPDDFPYVYKLPQFPMWLQRMLDTRSPQCKEHKCRRAILDALFDDLIRFGCYPTSRMFQETARALVDAHAILKDKQYANARPHDSWVTSLRDKFKKYRSRHAQLCNSEELEKMKEKFGKTKRKLDTDGGSDDTLTSVKRIKVSPLNDSCDVEDQFSINMHIKVLQQECQKRNPDQAIIKDKMFRTFEHRMQYVSSHSVAETLQCFPPLKQTSELLNEANRLQISAAVLKDFLILKKSSLSELAGKRAKKNTKLENLIKAQAECASTEESELGFALLVLPCLMQEKFPMLYAEEGTEINQLQPIIVHRNSSNALDNSSYELFLDRQLVTRTDDLVSAFTLWFTLFWLFDVGYNKKHLKLLSFLDNFIFKKYSAKIPRSLKTLYNSI